MGVVTGRKNNVFRRKFRTVVENHPQLQLGGGDAPKFASRGWWSWERVVERRLREVIPDLPAASYDQVLWLIRC